MSTSAVHGSLRAARVLCTPSRRPRASIDQRRWCGLKHGRRSSQIVLSQRRLHSRPAPNSRSIVSRYRSERWKNIPATDSGFSSPHCPMISPAECGSTCGTSCSQGRPIFVLASNCVSVRLMRYVSPDREKQFCSLPFRPRLVKDVHKVQHNSSLHLNGSCRGTDSQKANLHHRLRSNTLVTARLSTWKRFCGWRPHEDNREGEVVFVLNYATS